MHKMQSTKNYRYFLTDFVAIQRKSFFELLEKGIIEEFSKRNPITNTKKDLELVFYPEYYKLTRPDYTPYEAILKSKSYTSKLFIPAQLTNKKTKTVQFKWVFIGNIPIMTKRGHFILNGAARVIVNQILRSPGIYYQQKVYETYTDNLSQKPEDSYKRYYADLICQRGTWLRIEMDKEKNIWAQMKKGPKIPVFWFLIAMGLTEKIIFKTVTDSEKLVKNLKGEMYSPESSYCYVKNPPQAWSEIYKLITFSGRRTPKKVKEKALSDKALSDEQVSGNKDSLDNKTIYSLKDGGELTKQFKNNMELGRKWLYNKFMNPRAYDLGKQGRLAFNRKLGLNITLNQTTLTGLDVLYATDYLIKVEKGIYKTDDIDHLKNRRVRTSGELIQMQIGIGLVRLEKSIREAMNKMSADASRITQNMSIQLSHPNGIRLNTKKDILTPNILTSKNAPRFRSGFGWPRSGGGKGLDAKVALSKDKWLAGGTGAKFITGARNPEKGNVTKKGSYLVPQKGVARGHETANSLNPSFSTLINNKAFNSAIREFFGTSPLSQFMDQINPLAELTHKRRLSSMGPGGVTRDTATLAIRGIHPTHYGRICPVETPEGKNTGLVNSMTAYARVNPNGIIESPFYKVFKGQVQKTTGMYYFSAEQEEKIRLAASDLQVSNIGFLPNSNIPVRIAEDFTKIPRRNVQFIGISPVQMISIATSLIPFLEHDDANRALMGSNMQRQAVPLIRPERPIVGTGLEARAVSDSGHALQTQYSGFVGYVSAKKIIVYSSL